uniref:F-box only protein 6-like n=1 Tax=Paramormyrops kingsleyae TaxID=1676925 RepID=A0A3B3SIZ1_9TELE|nr:F-box only protein 6-like isoform X2 [Paramormyrops kingsleyae]XP_023649298.1 F-box only protein 6-like isoform X2 [Paramormyrops kingsleyae]XP_023649299.1 F-box only protein 6-like isoform X2 [Paramormyrops kingsleyae]XP_023649300.1 F-box only protein 6-like isoform X2 [Paramormyrops kingsleyae]
MDFKWARMKCASFRMLPLLPTAVLEEVFLNISPHDVVCVCRLVCHQWKEIVDSASYWRERCRREGLKLRNQNKCPEDWCQFYILSKNRRNLLKNTRADEMFTGWTIMLNGGDGWKIEDVALNFPDEGVKKYFVTSYGSCKKSQLIDVVKEGFGPYLMDEIQPDIIISDWFSPRWDCGCVYEICVQLLDQEQRVIETFCPDPVTFPQWNEMQWERMTHVFRDYGPGVRFIRFTHGGQDTQFWAGWYGIRVTHSSVEISPAMVSE